MSISRIVRVGIVSVLAASGISGRAFAAPSLAEQLIQACQSLKRQADRGKCLEEAVKSATASAAPPSKQETPSTKEVAQARAEKAFAAAQAIQSVVATGISLVQYQPYIHQFSIALDQYRAAAQLPDEKEAISRLDQALQAYSDAALYWRADIEFYSRSDNRLAYAGGLPANLAGTTQILDRYQVPTRKSDMWGINQGAPLSVALTTIWGYAGDQIKLAKHNIDSIGTAESKGDT